MGAAAVQERFVLVVRATRLDELIVRFNTVQQAQFYVEHMGGDFADYLAEHHAYVRAVAEVEGVLRGLGRVQRLDRAFLPNFVFGPQDRVVVLGQDGLVANTMKYLDGQRVIGVNPDPARWDGVLLPFAPRDVAAVACDEIAGRRRASTVTMAKATLNNGQVLYAVNDLFIGPRSHTSARYVIELAGRSERHSSSGVIVSTGLGSTGWLRSIYAGWAAMNAALNPGQGRVAGDGSFPRDAEWLHFFVREPFPSRTTQAELVVGRVAAGRQLILRSEMPEAGIIFSDGIEADYLEFNSGTLASIELADKRGLLVV